MSFNSNSLRLFFRHGMVCFAVACLCVLTASGQTDTAGPRIGEVYTVQIEVSAPSDIDTLTETGFNISHVHGNVVSVNATADELSRLRDLGYTILAYETEPKLTPELKVAAGYHTYASMTAALQTFAAAYGLNQAQNADICRLYTLGQSTQGRELWAMLITNNPDVEEDEPEFKYVATIHGDEIMGTEMCMRFIEQLLTQYGADSSITSAVNTTAIWIVPLMNPDGHTAGIRGNATGIDLNRHFPRWAEDWAGTIFDGAPLNTAGRQPETTAIMEWSADNSFVLAANYHGGARLVNYPYDDDNKGSGNPAPSPDEAMFREISLRYSINNPALYNTPSPYFEFGIVNGSDWFEIPGGMQDWNYRYMACNAVTLEISIPKTPAGSAIDSFWNDNKTAMLAYMNSVHMGVRGIVSAADTGAPLYAEVRVTGNAQPVFTDPDIGDYHRMLLPGAYDLTFSAFGFQPKTITNVTAAEPATRLDVTLDRLPIDADINNDTVIDARDVQLVINARYGISIPFDADVDSSGSVDAIDVQLVVLAILAG